MLKAFKSFKITSMLTLCMYLTTIFQKNTKNDLYFPVNIHLWLTIVRQEKHLGTVLPVIKLTTFCLRCCVRFHSGHLGVPPNHLIGRVHLELLVTWSDRAGHRVAAWQGGVISIQR